MDKGAISYRRFLAGDDGGIAQIVEEYKDGLTLYLRGYVKDIYAAEELAEDTFFRLITKKPKFSGRSSFKSWLYAIGRNVAVDSLRRGAKSVSVPVQDMEACLRDERSLEDAYIAEERNIRLYRALSSLREDHRQVLWLSYFEGFSNSEVAAALHKNERQIRNLLYRAKQALRAALEKEEIEL